MQTTLRSSSITTNNVRSATRQMPTLSTRPKPINDGPGSACGVVLAVRVHPRAGRDRASADGVRIRCVRGEHVEASGAPRPETWRAPDPTRPWRHAATRGHCRPGGSISCRQRHPLGNRRATIGGEHRRIGDIITGSAAPIQRVVRWRSAMPRPTSSATIRSPTFGSPVPYHSR